MHLRRGLGHSILHGADGTPTVLHKGPAFSMLTAQCLPHALQFYPNRPERTPPPPNTKVEFNIEFNSPEFALMARKYKADGQGVL